MTPAVRTLIVGCGNILRGDDAVGPVLIRHLWERGLPDGVQCADGGTGGMDVAFKMRGVGEVILVDACTGDSEPGTLFEVPGPELEELPPLQGINLHAFKWNHALAFARWLLKDEYPARITVYLIEAACLDLGAPLSPPVDAAMRRLVDLLEARIWVSAAARGVGESMVERETTTAVEGACGSADPQGAPVEIGRWPSKSR